MLYVTLAALGVAALAVVSVLPIVRYVIRSAARERDLLINQILYQARTPWQEPPREPATPEDLVEDLVYANPEQRDW